MFEHFLRYLIVSNHTISEWTGHFDFIRGAPIHLAGFFADLYHLALAGEDGNDRGFLDHNSFALDVDKHIHSSEVDADISA